MGLAIVDLDGTLIGGWSSEARFAARLVRTGQVRGAQFAAAAAFFSRYTGVYGRHVAKKNKAYLAGLDIATVEAAAREFVAKTLCPLLRTDMLRRIEAHRSAGEPIALLTGSPSFIAEPVAEILGAAVYRATECARSGAVFAPDPPLEHPFGPAKLAYAEELCSAAGVPLEAVTAYADAIDDLPLLARVGHPVAVTPDRGLARAAEAAGWEILRIGDGVRRPTPSLAGLWHRLFSA
jgi:HAD superfamily hydrolase (TIGR01490 family)